MAGEMENALRSVAEKISSYVEDAATMTVVTQYVQVSETGDVTFESAKPIARTIVRLDGDSEAILPVRMAESGSGRLEVDPALFDIHERNVAAATEYRSNILRALIEALPSRFR
jgi:hypothetical protein